MISNNFFKSMRKAMFLSASFLLVFNACRKDGDLNPEFEENTINSVFTDTVTIESSTRIGDSVLADRIAVGLVGTYRDSAFGTVKSNIYVQPLLPSNAAVFGNVDETLIVDSVVFSLEYSSHFGDTTIAQTFDVFRLSETLDSETSYFSDTTIQSGSVPVGSITTSPKPNVTNTIIQPNSTGGNDTIAVSSQLRIKLDNAIGTEILSKSGQTEVSDNDNFTAFFQGLKLSPRDNGTLNNNEAAILYFGLTALNTKMTIYYKAINPANDSTKKSVDFPINTTSVRFNTFEHDYTNSAVETVLNNPGIPSMFAYTEAMAGVETVIKFPNFKSSFQGKILINKAELILPVAGGSYDEFGVATAIVAASRNDLGALEFIPDAFENTDYFGGQYKESSQTYTFNIARYLQAFLNENISSEGLTILVTGSAVRAERSVFQSENNSGRKIRLNLYYTNIQ